MYLHLSNLPTILGPILLEIFKHCTIVTQENSSINFIPMKGQLLQQLHAMKIQILLTFLLLHSHFVLSLSFTSFLFGDSLVDTGNNNYLFTLSKADSPPYGIDFAPSGGRPTGRFTNGLTIADIIGFKTSRTHTLFFVYVVDAVK